MSPRIPLFCLLSGLWFLAPPGVKAQTDSNGNSLDDEWEKAWNNGQLFSPAFDPQADPDRDGWKSITESTAGTNPFDPQPPVGIILPEISATQPVYEALAPSPGALPVLLEPSIVTLTWPTIPGKTYRVCVSSDLLTWADASETFVGSGSAMTYETAPLNTDGTQPGKLFWRIETGDTDSDADTLTDYEEIRRNLNALSSDTDLDGLPDNTDSHPLDSATLADPDGMGMPAAALANLVGWWDMQSAPTSIFPLTVPSRAADGAAFHNLSEPNGTVTAESFAGKGIATLSTNPTHIDLLALGQSSSLRGKTSLSLNFWMKMADGQIKPEPGKTTPNQITLFSYNNLGGEIPNFEWSAVRSGNSTRFSLDQGNRTNSTQYFTPGAYDAPGFIDDGKWHHYALVIAGNNTRMYLDGIQVGPVSGSLTGFSIPSNVNTTGGYIMIGGTYAFQGAAKVLQNELIGEIDGIMLNHGRLDAADPLIFQKLHRRDRDNDGLWDVTEVGTKVWYDSDSNGIPSNTEYSYLSSPSLWQASNTDTDRDGATDLVEQTANTFLWKPDTDGDLIPDGFEIGAGMNPLDVADALLDSDQDGASNINEYRHNSSPNATNTDGDGKTDGEEINGPDGNPETDDGSDPNDSTDNGVRRPDDQLVFFKLGVGDRSSSHSEDYVLNVYRYVTSSASETKVFTLRSGGIGQYAEVTRSFRKGELYTFQLQWLGTSRNIKPALPATPAQKPDWDYHMVVEPVQGTLGVLADSYDPYARTHLPNSKLLDPEDILPTDDDNDNIQDLPNTLTPKRVLFVPMVFERDEDVPDGNWQPLAGQLAKALPGHRINLRLSAPLLPTRLKITDFEWILPATNFKDYTANENNGVLTQMEPADLLKRDVGFYLAGTGEKTVKLKLKLDGVPRELNATMNIEKPTATYIRTMGTVRFPNPGDIQLYLYAGLFPNEGQLGGLSSKGTVAVPAGWPEGQWNWVQVGTSARSLTELDGTYKINSKNGIYGLDTSYPYDPIPELFYQTGGEQATADSPSLLLSGYQARTADDDFSMYMMFLPNGVASRCVPLKKLRWGWDAEVSKDQEGWHITSQHTYSENPEETTEHPEWSANLKGGEYNQPAQ